MKNEEPNAKSRKDKTSFNQEDITELFCFVGDFCKMIEKDITKARIKEGKKVKRATKISELTMRKIMTIIVMYQQLDSRCFKRFYKKMTPLYRRKFPKMLTYERFAALMPRTLYLAILQYSVVRRGSKIAFMDSTSLMQDISELIKFLKG